jgi:PAS domain S-box-containing protein
LFHPYLSYLVIGLTAVVGLLLLIRYLLESRYWHRRRQASEAAERERQFHILFDAMPLMAWTARPDGFIDYYNEEWYRYTGTTFEEMKGWGWQKVHDPKMLPLVLVRWRYSLETGSPMNIAFPIRGKDGVFRWFLTRVNPILDQDHNVVGWVGVNTDINEQTVELGLLNAQLNTTQQRLNLALDAAEVGVYELDLTTNVVWRSLRHDQIYGYEELQPQWTTETFISHVVEEDRARVNDIMQRGMIAGVYHFECRIVRNHSIRWIEIQGKTIRNAQGEPAFLTGTVSDITERKEHSISQEYLSAIAEFSVDAIITMSLDGIVTSWNKGAESLYGYPAAEMIGRPVSILMPPERRQDLDELLATVSDGESVRQYETKRLTKAGTAIDVSLTVSPIEDSTGKPIHACAIARDVSANKRAEDALRNAKDFLNSIFQNAPDAIFVIDTKGLIYSLNSQGERMLGYTSAELIGKPVDDLIPERLKTEYLDYSRHFFENPQKRVLGADLELHALRKDHSEIPIDITLSPVKTDKGSMIMATVRDLTKQKQLESDRAKIEDALKEHDILLKKSKPDVTLVRQVERVSKLLGAIVSILGACVITGCIFNIPALRNPTPWGCFIPMNAGICLLLGGVGLSTAHTHRSSLRYLSLAAGAVVSIIALVTLCEWIFQWDAGIDQLLVPDLTLRYAVIPGRMAISAALASFLLGIGLIAEQRKQITVSQICGYLIFTIGTLTMIGHTYGFITLVSFGSSTLVSFPITIAQILTGAALFLSHPEQGIAQIIVSSSLGGRVGRRLLPLILLVPLMGLSSGVGRSTAADLLQLTVGSAVLFPIAVWLVARTMDRLDRQKDQALDRAFERKEALELANRKLEDALDRALQASNLKSAFVANISHELRTPLSGIIGNTELLLGAAVTPEERQQSLETTLGCSQSLLQIVNELLDLSKIESGKLSLTESPFNLLAPVESVVNLLTEAARRKGLSLKVDQDPDLPTTVIGDRGRLQQVLLNLANNAVKFTDAGEIHFRIIREKSDDNEPNICRVLFEVIDTGIGISEKDQSLLFKPFSQVDSSITRKYGGAGLGLSLCKSLVELMGGTIGVDSTNGKYSKFWFIVPFKQSTLIDFSPPAARPVTEVKEFHDKIILVVEDNLVVQKLVMKQLSSLGMLVLSASNGMDALNMVSESRFDVILMDCNLPDISGLDVTKEIRKMEISFGYHTPIVAMTAAAMTGDKENCLAAGMDDYLSKPVSIHQLRQTLERWLTVAQATQMKDHDSGTADINL